VGATLEATISIDNKASRTLRDLRVEAVATDLALMRAGRSANTLGDAKAMRSYGNAQTGLRGVRQEADKGNVSLGMFANKITLIGGAVTALLPAIQPLIGMVVQLTGSLARAAGGAGVIGGGALGTFAVGLGTLLPLMKGMQKDIATSQQLFTAYNSAVAIYGVNSTRAATAAKRLNQELKLAPDNTLALIVNLKAAGLEWDKYTNKAQGALMGLAAFALGRWRQIMPSYVKNLITPDAQAVAGAGKGLIDQLIGSSALGDMTAIGKVFRQMVPDAAHIAGDVVIIALRLIKDAAPFARTAEHDFRLWADHFDKVTQDSGYITGIFHRWTSEFYTWWGLLKGVWGFMSALLGSSTGGQSQIEGITKAFAGWSDWFKDNPVKMQRFWAESTKFAGGLGKALVYVVKLVWDLAGALTPVSKAVLTMLSPLGPSFVTVLKQLADFLTVIFGGFGSLGGPLGIFLSLLNSVLGGINTLVKMIPGLGLLLSGAFAVFGIIRFATWIQTATIKMLGLAAATNDAAAATARLAGAEVAAGGAGGAGGLAFLGGSRLGTAGGIGYDTIGSTFAMETPAMGFGLSGGAVATSGLAALMARGSALSGRLAAGARLAGKVALPLMAALGAYDAITTKRSGGTLSQVAQTIAGVGHGATFGLLPNLPTSGSLNAGALNAIQGGGTAKHVGGHLGLLSGFSSALVGPVDGRTINAGLGLNAKLAATGGQNPTTLRQIGRQIAAYTTALVQARGLSGAAAATFRGEVNSNLAILRTAAAQLKAQASHGDFMKAINFGSQLSPAYNLVNAKQGPAAAMDFVVKLAVAKLKTLGPTGRKELADGMLLWGNEMEKQNPALMAEFDKMRNGALGKVDSTLATASTGTTPAILQGMTMTWPKIQKAMTDPMELAREMLSTTFTRIQNEAVGSLEAMGYTATQAMKIVQGMEKSGLTMIPGGKLSSGARKALFPPGIGSITGATTGSRASYSRSTLSAMGITPTAANVSFMTAWAQRESVPQNIDAFNLWGTTLPMGGSNPAGTNSAHVQSYGTRQAGVKASASMLSGMPLIAAALASGDPQAYRASLSPAKLAQLNQEMLSWSGGGYAWPTSAGAPAPAAPAKARNAGRGPSSRTAQSATVVHMPVTVHVHDVNATKKVVVHEVKKALAEVATHIKNTGVAREEGSIK
jgi:hypothetical protein